jgi:hypothetical protein
VAPEIADVVADTSDPELSEVRKVLANLGGVQVELLRKRLGGNGADTGAVELPQTPQVHRQPVRREL